MFNRRQLLKSFTTLTAVFPRNITHLVVAIQSMFASPNDGESVTWKIKVNGLNGLRVPAIIGASGSIDSPRGFTGFDYFEWFGITHHRYWFKLPVTRLDVTTELIKDENTLKLAIESLRRDPLRQTANKDIYIDWTGLNNQFDVGQRYIFERFKRIGIVPMMINSFETTEDPLASWSSKFEYWRMWYSYVYFFASQYDIALYEFANEPNAKGGSFTNWRSHWLVCADAMRSAISDVNNKYNKSITLNICGPTLPGPWWDERLTDPTANPHGWGSLSWKSVKQNLYGEEDSKIWNYGMYDYHAYSTDAAKEHETIMALRYSLATAKLSPNKSIPLLITEYNTSTGANFMKKCLDTEDLTYGIALAQIIQSTAIAGGAGLGDEGGFFLFKLGAPSDTPVLKNSTAYVSSRGHHNYGGVSRGGACFQMYARHFRGSKPLVDFSVLTGDHEKRRLVIAWDKALDLINIYLSNQSGSAATLAINLSSIPLAANAEVSIACVDKNNTGQIAKLVRLGLDKVLNIEVPDNSALCLNIAGKTYSKPSCATESVCDTYLTIGDGNSDHSALPALKISQHHTLPSERRIGFVMFDLEALPRGRRYLLRLSGQNTGQRPAERNILHLYGAGPAEWQSRPLTWNDAVGVGRYMTEDGSMAPTTGLGSMVDIEDNYGGVTSGIGRGLGIYGKFLGPMSFFSPTVTTLFVDVTSYIESCLSNDDPRVTFVIASTVRYDVHQFVSNYYEQGVFDLDGRLVEIASREHPDEEKRPALITWC
jgi:hypothetical protein